MEENTFSSQSWNDINLYKDFKGAGGSFFLISETNTQTHKHTNTIYFAFLIKIDFFTRLVD